MAAIGHPRLRVGKKEDTAAAGKHNGLSTLSYHSNNHTNENAADSTWGELSCSALPAAKRFFAISKWRMASNVRISRITVSTSPSAPLKLRPYGAL